MATLYLVVLFVIAILLVLFMRTRRVLARNPLYSVTLAIEGIADPQFRLDVCAILSRRRIVVENCPVPSLEDSDPKQVEREWAGLDHAITLIRDEGGDIHVGVRFRYDLRNEIGFVRTDGTGQDPSASEVGRAILAILQR
ncbi:MAG: hypothetical protein WC734_05140 [Patescibacteria group bacterium]|jgi:hypothetical protein